MALFNGKINELYISSGCSIHSPNKNTAFYIVCLLGHFDLWLIIINSYMTHMIT